MTETILFFLFMFATWNVLLGGVLMFIHQVFEHIGDTKFNDVWCRYVVLILTTIAAAVIVGLMCVADIVAIVYIIKFLGLM